MVAFWRDIRTRQRPDGLPGASQTFPPAGETAAAVAAPVPAEDAAALGCVSTCDGLPGPECFGTTLLPSWRHTWHQPLLGAQSGPGWSGGSSGGGSGDKAGPGSGGDGSGGGFGAVGTVSADSHHGIVGPSCKTATAEVTEERRAVAGVVEVEVTEERSAVAGVVVEVTPASVPSVWEEVGVRQCRAKGRTLRQLKGLPAYDLCFQGF